MKCSRLNLGQRHKLRIVAPTAFERKQRSDIAAALIDPGEPDVRCPVHQMLSKRERICRGTEGSNRSPSKARVQCELSRTDFHQARSPPLTAETRTEDDPRPGSLTSSGFQKAKLLERRDAIVETDLFRDLAILDTEYGCPGEPHLATGCRRKRADEEIAERRPGVRAAAMKSSRLPPMAVSADKTRALHHHGRKRRGWVVCRPSRLARLWGRLRRFQDVALNDTTIT